MLQRKLNLIIAIMKQAVGVSPLSEQCRKHRMSSTGLYKVRGNLRV